VSCSHSDYHPRLQYHLAEPSGHLSQSRSEGLCLRAQRAPP
jgi:hypothetical protein